MIQKNETTPRKHRQDQRVLETGIDTLNDHTNLMVENEFLARTQWSESGNVKTLR